MSYWKVRSASVIEVADFETLLTAWKTLKSACKLNLISAFEVAQPLSSAQEERLPADLRPLVLQAASHAA